MKLLVLGLGYGTANAILLSQYNDVICFDIENNRVDQKTIENQQRIKRVVDTS